MGLDVYLYRYRADPAVIKAAEQAYQDAIDEEIYGDDVDATMSDEERKAKRLEIAARWPDAKLDEWGESGLREEINEPSATYPDDICSVGYFRSSYNDAGMNHRLRNAVGRDLDWIFNVTDRSDYRVIPDWDQALDRVNTVIAEVEQFMAKTGNVTVHKASFNPFVDPSELASSPQRALEIYQAEKAKADARTDGDKYDYSNRDGLFAMVNPMTVKAVIAGFEVGFTGQPMPVQYLIVDNPPSDNDSEPSGLGWPLQSLRVVKETIEWVLAQPDKDKMVLHWSA